MDPLSSTAAAGMRSRLEALDILANNLSNASTNGFKGDREAYSLYLGPESGEGSYISAGYAQTTAPNIEAHRTDFTQGQLVPTEVSTDLALSGQGFFLVDAGTGPLLTRNGKFQVTKEGKLTTQEGYEFETVEQPRIRAVADAPIEVSADGSVRQNGITLGRLKLLSPAASIQPHKHSGAYFSLDTTSLSLAKPSTATIHQGNVEAANITPASSAVQLVSVLRQFETLQRATQIGSDLNKRAIEEVAKVNP